MHRRLLKLARDERGVAALEFALIAPVMIIVFFGVVEAGQAVVAGRRTGHAASALADLATQKPKFTDADVADSFAAAQAMLKPMDPSKLTLKLTSVTADANKVPKVDWSEAQGMSKDTPGSTYSGLPAGLVVAAGDTAIVATAKYTLIQASKTVIKQDLSYSKMSYTHPRAGTVSRTTS